MKYILSLDQGTSSTRSIIFDGEGEIISSDQKEHRQIYPRAAWVEHDAIEIKENALTTMSNAIKKAAISWSEVASIGITNQRETTVAWNKSTGLPLYNAIVWQCRRTADVVEELKKDYLDFFHEKTGLILDAYFSGTKIKWLLDNVASIGSLPQSNLAFGTIDSWLIFCLTGEHRTDASNASRTLLVDINTGTWDEELASILKIPIVSLPKIHENASETPFGYYKRDGVEIPIRGVLGDQQAALFGQVGLTKGSIKTTYGTGNFSLLNTGQENLLSKNGLLSTIGWQVDGKMTYALEGSVFITGAALQWLRDEVQIIEDYKDIDQLSQQTQDSGGIYFVPAFVGLGAPYWDSSARGMIIGITRGTHRGHLLHATLDAIAFQTDELLETMRLDANVDLDSMRVDGGITKSAVLMQKQADISGVKIEIPKINETTAFGAALMAGYKLIWDHYQELEMLNPTLVTYTPKIELEETIQHKKAWKNAVARCRNWI